MELSITIIIVIVTCIVSIGGFGNQKTINDLIFYPPAVRRQPYRFISHGFIHADFIHLAFNMLALYSFGEILEKEYLFSHPCIFGVKGKYFFLLLYFLGLIVASLPDYFKYRDSYHFRSLGASGAVSAVIFAAITLWPQLPIRFFFIPINIPGIIFGVIYLIITAYLDKRGGGNINHSAHLWGALFGIVFTLSTVSLLGNLDVYENFMRQIQSLKQVLPFDCKF